MEDLIYSKSIQQSIEDIKWLHNYDIETFGFTKIKFKWNNDNHRRNQRVTCYAER
jgi:hypothetical protein